MNHAKAVSSAVVVLTLLASACAMTPETRSDLALKQAMEAASAEVTLEQVAEAARTLPVSDLRLDSPPCLLCVEAVHCEGDTCGIWMRPYAEQLVILARREGPQTSLKVRHGSNRHGGFALLELWRAIDPPTAEAALARATRPEAPLAFEPRWSPVIQLHFHGGQGPHLGQGVRGGALRWHSPVLFTSYALDVGKQQRAAVPRTRDAVDLAFQVRVGLSRWSRHTDQNYAIPGVAGYLHAAPVLELDRGAFFGWRGGVGFSTGPLGGPLFFAVFVETYAMQLLDQGAPFIGLLLGAGT